MKFVTRISLAGHEAISYHPAHTYTDGSSQCEFFFGYFRTHFRLFAIVFRHLRLVPACEAKGKGVFYFSQIVGPSASLVLIVSAAVNIVWLGFCGGDG